jgi:hypothetical protein
MFFFIKSAFLLQLQQERFGATTLRFRCVCLKQIFFFNNLLGIQFGTVAQHLENVQQGGIKL